MYKILEVSHLTESTVRLRTERPQVKILAGQCFNVGVLGSGINREYSIYSAADAPYLDFLIKVVDAGCVSPILQKLRVGDVVEIDGPYGDFCLKEDEIEGQHFVFLATGTGIAPFHSFALTYPTLSYAVLHGIREPNEQYGSEDFRPGSYIPCISRNNPDQTSARITDYISSNPIGTKSIIYLCGNRNMIVDALEILREQGVPGDNLITEVFF